MRLFASLAFAVAYVAASGCASNCTQNILTLCTPRFQWKDTSDGTNCFLLDLAPPTASLWMNEGDCTADIADFNMTTADKIAWTDNFTVVDNSLTFETDCVPAPAPRRVVEESTLIVQFKYASSTTSPQWCGSGCNQKLKLYTNFPSCEGQQPADDSDNDLASTWRGGSSSGRTSGRRGSSRRNSASSNGNDGTRRTGCANPLFNIDVNATNAGSICQIGQCCGTNFCDRDRSLFDCLALEETAGWRVGSFCDDQTCKPVYGEPGNGAGAGGKDVILGSSLENAEGALPTGGHLEISTRDVNEQGSVPAFNGGAVLIAFDVDRTTLEGTPIEGFLPTGQYILVNISSEALDGGEILLLRWDDDTSSWVNSLDDCEGNGATGLEITFDEGSQSYIAPICHTSTFIVTSASDSKDKKDAKDLKATKKAKPGKKTLAKDTKAPKDVTKKAAKKGKAEIAIGVGVAGAAVALAGVGVLVSRRRNKNKKNTTATATPAGAEVAVVSV